MTRLLGIETEYGLHVEGVAPDQLVAEARAVVQAYEGPSVTGWNYAGEDPRRDWRGFRVEHLQRDPGDAAFDICAPRFGSLAEEHSDRVLGNGARLYNDHGHPEYSTPECTDLRSLVAHDRAGEQIVAKCARLYAATTGRSVRLYKNNTDYHGACYGTHESYLLRRSVAPDVLIGALSSFLATRQVFAGAGKVGRDLQPCEASCYQISQRAEYVDVVASVDTQYRRPLVNTRDEPHACARDYCRLHVIAGDANMSEWATAMKVGTLALVLDLLEEGWVPHIELVDAVAAVHAIAPDPDLRTAVPVRDRRTGSVSDWSPLAIQHVFLEAAAHHGSALPDREWVLGEWSQVLADLADDPERTCDRVDWVAKRRVLREYAASCRHTPTLDELRSVELGYHDVNPETSLFAALRDVEGSMRRLVSDAQVSRAASEPPADTRAFIRGHCVRHHAEAVTAIGWNTMAFRYNSDEWLFDMNALVDGHLAPWNTQLASAKTMDETVAALRQYRPAPLFAGTQPQHEEERK